MQAKNTYDLISEKLCPIEMGIGDCETMGDKSKALKIIKSFDDQAKRIKEEIKIKEPFSGVGALNKRMEHIDNELLRIHLILK